MVTDGQKVRTEWTDDAKTSSGDNKTDYYIPSTFYVVNLPLALGNISHLTTSILAQSHDATKNL